MNNTTQTVKTNSNTNSNDAKWLDILQYTLFTLIFVVSTFGNTLVCLVIATTRRMRTTRNYLLVNLAVSDLTVALLCIPFDMVVKITEPEWQLGDAMCKLLWPSMTLVTNSSAATLAIISYDRWVTKMIKSLVLGEYCLWLYKSRGHPRAISITQIWAHTSNKVTRSGHNAVFYSIKGAV